MWKFSGGPAWPGSINIKMCWQQWEQKFPLWSGDRSEISLTSSCSASTLFFFYFICFTFTNTGALEVYKSTANNDYALLAHVKHFACNHLNWLRSWCAIRHCSFFFFFKHVVCVQCMHKTGIRANLNTWLPEKGQTYNCALNYISEANNKVEKEVSVKVLFDCWPLRDLSAD